MTRCFWAIDSNGGQSQGPNRRRGLSGASVVTTASQCSSNFPDSTSAPALWLLGHRGWFSEDATFSRLAYWGFPQWRKAAYCSCNSPRFFVIHMRALPTELRERYQFRLNRRGWDPMARLPLFIVATLVPLLSMQARTPDQQDLRKQLTLSQAITIATSNNAILSETQSRLDEVGHGDSIRPSLPRHKAATCHGILCSRRGCPS